MMSIDSRGVSRGRCTLCHCEEYHRGMTGLKCMQCGHPPGKHLNVNSQSNGLGQSTTSNTQQFGAGHSDSIHSHRHPTASFYQPSVSTKKCGAPGCTKPSFYNPSAGEFDYCSPVCRDKYLLPKERQRLQDDLEQFKAILKISMSPSTTGKSNCSRRAYGSPSGVQESNKKLYSAVASESSKTSGKQVTLQTMISQKSDRDIGLIIGEKICREDPISGLLVLGFEYGTEAEDLVKRGEVCLLDVITSLNSKKANEGVYKKEMRKGTISVELNRSIALRSVDNLLTKAKILSPTHFVVVINPKNAQQRSWTMEKGFGLGTSLTGNLVTSVTKDTPARFSGIEYGDNIVAFGFVNNGQLEIREGNLNNEKLSTAASAGSTLLVAFKRGTQNK